VAGSSGDSTSSAASPATCHQSVWRNAAEKPSWFARIPLGENALGAREWMIATSRGGELPTDVIAFACDLLPLYVTAIA
jgi:hypothetical protein